MLEYFNSLNPELWKKYHTLLKEKTIEEKTILLNEGDISKNIYFVKKGCLRLWFNKDGKDITFQFFFEKQLVSVIESFMNEIPSMFTLEAIEETTLYTLSKSNFDKLISEVPHVKDGLIHLLIQRLTYYNRLFLSRIKDNPRERYQELVKDNPHIMKRVPQHYIASYLGITSVSFSRIKNKNKF
jgi:CRP-like cAMP-binding protein